VSGRIRVANPEGDVARQPHVLAPLPASLSGLRIGVLDNGKPNARLLLTTVAERLAGRAGARVGPVEGKGNAAAAGDADLLAKLRLSADVVLTGSGD